MNTTLSSACVEVVLLLFILPVVASGSSHLIQSSKVPKSSSRIGSSTLPICFRFCACRLDEGKSGSDSIDVVGVVMLDVFEKISLTKSRSRSKSCAVRSGLLGAQEMVEVSCTRHVSGVLWT